MLIDTNLLTKINEGFILSCIIGIYFVLFQSGSLPPLTNPAFVLGLFFINWVPGVNFFIPPIEQTPKIELYLQALLLIDEIDPSHKLDTNSTNAVTRDYCTCHDASMSIAKGHLKHDTFKNMVAEKYYVPQQHLGKKSHADLLKSDHKYGMPTQEMLPK